MVSGEFDPALGDEYPPTQAAPGPAEAERRGAGAAFVVGAIVAAGLVTFGFQNTDSVRIRFLWFDGSVPVWIAMASAVVGFALLAVLVAVALRGRRNRRPAS